MADFKVGDTVSLKSGGPAMTVKIGEGPNSTNTVECVFFNGGKLVTEIFKTATIEHVESEYSHVFGGMVWVPSSVAKKNRKKAKEPKDTWPAEKVFSTDPPMGQGRFIG